MRFDIVVMIKEYFPSFGSLPTINHILLVLGDWEAFPKFISADTSANATHHHQKEDSPDVTQQLCIQSSIHRFFCCMAIPK